MEDEVEAGVVDIEAGARVQVEDESVIEVVEAGNEAAADVEDKRTFAFVQTAVELAVFACYRMPTKKLQGRTPP